MWSPTRKRASSVPSRTSSPSSLTANPSKERTPTSHHRSKAVGPHEARRWCGHDAPVKFALLREKAVSWSLRYCPHVGYIPPDRMLFRLLGGPDRPSQVRFVAREGFAGIFYPWAGDSPPAERRAVAEQLGELKLTCSCIVTVPFTKLLEPLWVTDSGESLQS